MVLTDETKIENDEISSLKSFKIYGLFGYKDIELPLDQQVLILIAENGSGKTNILNILHYVLTENLDKLISFDFEKLSINFDNKQKLEITSEQLKDYFSPEYEYIKDDLLSLIEKLKPFLPPREILNLEKSIISNRPFHDIWQKISRYKRRSINIRSSTYINETIDEFESFKKSLQPILIDSKILNNKWSILYFPTYRRIEEDLSSLGYEDINLEDNSTKLIQFGMNDVKQNFRKIQKEIKDTAFNLFSQVTGEMLTQFIEGINITDEMKASIKPEILDVILSRVGEQNISQTEQQKIKNLVSSGEINNSKYNDLIYFLSKLINLYEQQRKIDESIKSFVKTCNKYLKPRKEIIYNESTAEIYIRQTRNNEPIDLRSLSSGEKQIISLFSKVYLESQEEFVLIIDEPELSLSVEWQEMLLPDIIDSGRCKLLVATTHSPFIFNNKLDSYAVDLDQFVTEC